MLAAPIPDNEPQRLKALYGLQLLDTAPEARFDRITRIATHLFDVPISTITLVDTNREWFKSCQGLNQQEGDRAISFCGHALLAEQLLVIPDATADERFKDNPMVVGKPYIRFYVGVPLYSTTRMRIGTFCIKGYEPRTFSSHEQQDLVALAAWAEHELNVDELTVVLEAQKTSEAALRDKVHELERMNKLMTNRELKMAMLKQQLKDCEATLTPHLT